MIKKIIISGAIFIVVVVIVLVFVEVNRDIDTGEAYGFRIGATKEETYLAVVRTYGDKDDRITYVSMKESYILPSISTRNFTKEESDDVFFEVDGLILSFDSWFTLDSLTLIFKDNKLVRMERLRSLIEPL